MIQYFPALPVHRPRGESSVVIAKTTPDSIDKSPSGGAINLPSELLVLVTLTEDSEEMSPTKGSWYWFLVAEQKRKVRACFAHYPFSATDDEDREV